jgi:uncharacterized delta-60 repeat protein
MDTRGSVVGIITTLFWLTGAAPVLAQAGTLDTTFSGDGKVATNFTPRGDFIWATALQADGKIVAAGGAGVGTGGAGTFALARYDTDGTLDSAFGGDGRVVTQMTLKPDVIQAVAIQADQKIVAAGRVGGSGGRYGLARYNPNGTLDMSFGGDGKVMTNLTTRWDHAWGVAIQPDGKIVVVGASGVGGGAFSALRYNPGGTLDTSFSSDGKVITHFTTGDDWAWDVALQADGKIVVGGVAGAPRSNKSVALVRYNANGSLDTSFGGDGKVMRNLTPGWDDASGIEIQADGKLVTAGATGGFGGQLLVLRIEADGTPDTTFSGDGKAATNFTARDDFAWDLALQADGKIVAAGTAGIGTTGAGSFAVARYGSNGVLDTTFSGDGKVATNVTPRVDVATAVAIQADGAIVVGGEVGGSGGRFGVVRYLGA